jgi:murein DD-endopeptidase MepM/ murein hydrolase activator NlpD
MAYLDDESFNNLSWMDKMRYVTTDQNRLESEKKRAEDVYKSTGSEEAKNYRGQLDALGSGVNPESVISGNYDTNKWTWRPPDDAQYGTGVRTALNQYGIDNADIGWADDGKGFGNVTINGQNVLTPDRVVNGVSYVDDKNKVLDVALDYYKSQGKNIVKLADYAQNSGLPFDVTYNESNGLVSIGGQTIKPTFVDGDYAYVDAAELDRALAAAKQQSGYQTGNELLEKYSEKYDPYYDKLLDALVNRKEYSYDPENDPVYQSYRQQYNREGDRAMRDAMGSMAGMTGGYTNSAAVTAGAQQRQYWDDQLMDRIPELEANAYNRYLGEFDMNRNALDAVMGLDNNQFNREYGVNRDLRSDILENSDRNRQRYADAYEKWLYERAYKDSRDDLAYDRQYQKDRDAVADSQWRETFDRSVYENDRDYDRAVYQDDRDYNRAVYQDDRDYNRAVYQDDRDYDRHVYENDRDYNRGVYEFDAQLDYQKQSDRAKSASSSSKGGSALTFTTYPTLSSDKHVGKEVDFAVPIGTPIQTPVSGTVVKIQSLTDSYGKNVRIRDADGNTHYFAHLSGFGDIQEGDTVDAGTIIGYSGDTGNGGAHLHYEVRRGDNQQDQLDPYTYINAYNNSVTAADTSKAQQKNNDDRVKSALNKAIEERGLTDLYDLSDKEIAAIISETIPNETERARILNEYNVSQSATGTGQGGSAPSSSSILAEANSRLMNGDKYGAMLYIKSQQEQGNISAVEAMEMANQLGLSTSSWADGWLK